MSDVRHKTIITLYRAAQKATRKLDAQFGGLEVRKPLDKAAWQNSAHEWSSPAESEHACPRANSLGHVRCCLQPLLCVQSTGWRP